MEAHQEAPLNSLDTFWIPVAWLLVSVSFDLVANWALVKSHGFRLWLWAIVAIGCISVAFACMAQALLVMPLSIAYALWSVLGIIGTVLIGRFCFKQHLSHRKYLALAFLTAGIVCMNLA